MTIPKPPTSAVPCQVPGCDKLAFAKNYCKQHYRKFVERPKKRAKLAALTAAAKPVPTISAPASDKASGIDRDKLERLFLTPCRTEQDLKNFIKYFFGLHLPDQKVSRYADTTPFHAIWEAYDICVNKNNPQNVQELLYVAGRGSGKCVERGTKVLTESGTKNIEDVKVGEIVYSGWSWQPVLQWFDEGEKGGVRFATESGRTLTGSTKHRVWGIRDWIYLIDLKIGDEIKVVDELDQDRSWNEKVVSVETVKAYFYDLEIEEDHAYWSNGFISHNTLGMAIAELLILFHDQRDVVHVGAILSQAKRCYEYQQKFMLSDRIRPIIQPPKIPDDKRILERTNMERSVFNIGKEKLTLEVIPCTLKACLTSSATVIDEKGIKRSISSLKEGDRIQNPDGFVSVVQNHEDHQECMRLELDDGRIIEGTIDHRVWTQRGWVELQYLTDDDDVLVVKGV